MFIICINIDRLFRDSWAMTARVSVPSTACRPSFTSHLAAAIGRAVAAPPIGDPAKNRPDDLAALTWGAVFGRVEAVRRLLIKA
jgi:hypothetical protein